MAFLMASCLISLLFISTVESDKTFGFTVDLIHRDSPLSPSYDASFTRFERLRNSIHRSFSRHSSFRRASPWSTSASTPPDSFDSSTISDDGAYLMKIHLGSPRKEIMAYADTGSDLTWTQCSPCRCYKQTAPFFYPENSTSYKVANCTSPQCADDENYACGWNLECKYNISYGDRSYSSGDLAAETLTFVSSSGKTTSFERFYFGCGRDNGGPPFITHASGVIGLGGGSISLVRQLERSAGGKFSYCLTQMDSHVPSKISFGTNAVVTGTAVVSTPLVKKDPDTFYFLTLEGFSVGSTTRLNYYAAQATTTKGNTIIDSGTTLTLVSNETYDLLESTLVKVIKGKRTSDPNKELRLCYELPSNGRFSAPPITAHFTGADLVLPDTSTFVKVGDGVTCFTFMPADEVAIFGNLHQMNFHVGYDLGKGVVNFQPMDCTKYK